MSSILKCACISANMVLMAANANRDFVCILSLLWFDIEMQTPPFQGIEKKLKDLFEQEWNYILKITYLR